MKSTLVATALGAFGLGALVSWAVTADIHENRASRERAGYDELLADKTEHIFALKREQQNVSRQLHQTLLRVGEIELPVETVLENVNIHSISIDPEPNAFGESIQIVEPEVEAQEDEEQDREETPEETKRNLQSLIDAYTNDPEAQEQFVEIATSVQEYDKTPPFVISRDVFAYDEEGEHYEKITLNYFARDRVLLDDDEDPMDDIAGMIGWRNLSRFGDESHDPNVVFVRNRRLQTDFEVVKDDEAQLPLHVKYGMGREEFRVNRAAGLIKLRREDE
jgi:hypothetical protein